MIYKTASVVYRLIIFIFLILYCVAILLVGAAGHVSSNETDSYHLTGLLLLLIILQIYHNTQQGKFRLFVKYLAMVLLFAEIVYELYDVISELISSKQEWDISYLIFFMVIAIACIVFTGLIKNKL